MGLDFKSRAARKSDVVKAVEAGGHPDAVAEQFGVSRASVFSWTKSYRELGAKGLNQRKADRRFSLPGETPSETIRNVLGFLRHRPDFSADELSDSYGDYGIRFPSRTMRNIFKKSGVSTAKERLEKAYKPDDSHIADEDLDAVIGEIEDEERREPSGRRPGDVLVQDRVEFPKDFCDGRLAIELIVDTFAPDQLIFAKVGAPDEQLSKWAFDEVRHIYELQSRRIHTVCTPRKQQYCVELGAFAYPEIVGKLNYTVLKVRPAKSRVRDSRIKAAWTLLQRDWLSSIPDRLKPEMLSLKNIEDDLNAWLTAHRK